MTAPRTNDKIVSNDPHRTVAINRRRLDRRRDSGSPSRRGCALATTALLVATYTNVAKSEDARMASFVKPTSAPLRLPSQHKGNGAAFDPSQIFNQSLSACSRLAPKHECTLRVRESEDGKLCDEQVIHVTYCQEPRGIELVWLENPGKARRIVWQQGKYKNSVGDELGIAEPASRLARMVAPTVKFEIHGEEARASSRMTIDEIGFRPMLERLIEESKELVARSDATWKQLPDSSVNGRRTIVLARDRVGEPRRGTDDEFRLVIHLDSEQMLPVAVFRFADVGEQHMLSRYVITDVLSQHTEGGTMALAK